MFEDPAVERMREAWARNTLLDEGGDALFEIRAEVGDKGPNGRVDVAKIETLLEASGALDLTTLKGPTGLFAAGKGAAIRAFQRANGLGEDGQVWRNGSTIRVLKAALKPKIRQAVAARAKAAAEARPPGDGTPEQRLPTQLAQTRPSGAELERAARELEGYTPDRHAFFERTGKWPNNEAWREIEFAKAKPNVTINPRMEAARIWAIRNNRKAVFDIKHNPNVEDGPADHRDHARGFTAVARYDAIIAREAKRQGVDPDLIRAIMYVENADGDPHGLNKAAEAMGWADSLLLMNINDRLWAGIGGVKRNEFKQPERNIHAGVALIKAISGRLRPADRTPAKIGTIWNSTGRENVNKIGARIQRAYDEKTWRIIEDHRR